MANENQTAVHSIEDRQPQDGLVLHSDSTSVGKESEQPQRAYDERSSPCTNSRQTLKDQGKLESTNSTTGTNDDSGSNEPAQVDLAIIRHRIKDMVKAQLMIEEVPIDPATVTCQIDPETYQQVLMKDTAGVKAPSLETAYKGGHAGILNPFHSKHFNDMQDVAVAKCALKLLKDGFVLTADKRNSRYMDIVLSLAAAGDFDAQLEEVIAAEQERMKSEPLRPFVEDHIYHAMVEYDRINARAPKAITKTLMNGTDDLKDAQHVGDGLQHNTIMPNPTSSRTQTRNIDAHLKKRMKQQKKENILLNYDIVGWGWDGIMPRGKDGRLVGGGHPLADKARNVLEKFLQTDKMLKEEDQLEATDAEGEEFDLIWTTKIDFLKHRQPYVIKRRGMLDCEVETEGLNVPPPPTPAGEDEDELQSNLGTDTDDLDEGIETEMRDAFWDRLKASSVSNETQATSISSKSDHARLTHSSDDDGIGLMSNGFRKRFSNSPKEGRTNAMEGRAVITEHTESVITPSGRKVGSLRSKKRKYDGAAEMEAPVKRKKKGSR